MYNRLIDYRKKPNNFKLYQILKEEFDSLEEVYETIMEWRQVDKAEGTALDQLGEEVGQYRGDLDDEVYRLMIKIKVLANNSKGDVYTVTRLIANVLGIDPSEFAISESYIKDENLAGMIYIDKVPLAAMLESGLSEEEFMRLVETTLAAGIGIEELVLEGTFEFVESLVTDHEHGFADIDMTVGGTLGAVMGKDKGGREDGV